MVHVTGNNDAMCPSKSGSSLFEIRDKQSGVSASWSICSLENGYKGNTMCINHREIKLLAMAIEKVQLFLINEEDEGSARFIYSPSG